MRYSDYDLENGIYGVAGSHVDGRYYFCCEYCHIIDFSPRDLGIAMTRAENHNREKHYYEEYESPWKDNE